MSATVHVLEVLGSGCARCQDAYRVASHVVDGLRTPEITWEVVKQESYERMAELGVMSTPAIAVDGKVLAAGRVPGADELRMLLALAS